MTKRSYYQDAYTHTFEANIIEKVKLNGRSAVILDHSYFYPTSGGQPHDMGTLNSVPVIDVVVRPEDEAVLHVLAGELAATAVTAHIDWPRRFDHMQQHSGQHILSQAFVQLADANTVSFHLSADSVTIDLDTTDLTSAQIATVEELSNQIIWQNRAINIQIVTLAQAQKMAIRKLPELNTQTVRLVEIADFDLTACGGTHVAQTGSVGLLKIVKVERRGEKSRITFLCGKRAVEDYQQKHLVVTELMNQLTTGATELETAVSKLQTANKSANRELKRLQTQLEQYEADELRQQATKVGAYTLVTHVFTERDPGSLRQLANQFVRELGMLALFAASNADKTHLIFCRAADAPGQMHNLLKHTLDLLGSKSGGGTPNFAQGVGPGSSEIKKAVVETAVANAAKTLVEQINRMG